MLIVLVLVFLRLRPARAVAGDPAGDGGLAGAVGEC